jgi:hypothetical protein
MDLDIKLLMSDSSFGAVQRSAADLGKGKDPQNCIKSKMSRREAETLLGILSNTWHAGIHRQRVEA